MLGKQSLLAAASAFSVSLIALVASVTLQGALMFHSSLERLSQPRLSSVRSLSKISDGRAAVLFSVVPTVANVGIQEFVGIYDFSGSRPRMRLLELDFALWAIAGSPHSGQLFISACDGGLYLVNMHRPACDPVLLGRQQPSPVHMLECADDGSLLIVGSSGNLTAWDVPSRRVLWQRTDLAATAGAFVPGSKRLVCGLECGTILELHSQTGETLRIIGTCDSWINGVTVSPCQTYLACMNVLGELSLTDLRSGRRLWSRDCATLLAGRPITPAVSPRFLSGQTAIAVAYAMRGKQLLIHSAATGEILAHLQEPGGDVKGLDVAENGLIYAWDDAGSVIAWDAAAGRVCQRFSPERDMARCSSAARSVRCLDLGAAFP